MIVRSSRALAALAAVGVVGLLLVGGTTADQTGTRTISIYNIHTKETVTVQYKKAGKYVPAAMERINWIMRDWRRNEPTEMDPELVDLIWEMHRELGSTEPIHLISGYRSRGTNDMLRSTSGGQASNSQHISGKAADIHFPDVPVQRLRYSALVRERGGVGYYPASALPFVHVDTARVRAWPRLPRHELAALFPGGQTQHIPDDGSPLTPDDSREARSSRPRGELAAFLDLRRNGSARSDTQVAEAIPVAPSAPAAQSTAPRPARPQLAEPPRQVALALPEPARPSAADRAGLDQLAAHASSFGEPRLVRSPERARRPAAQPLASLSGTQAPLGPAPLPGTAAAPQQGGQRVAAIDGSLPIPMGDSASSGRFSWGPRSEAMRWLPATEFDDEHPDELSYRPFAIAPLLTASADAPLLSDLTPYDPARTLELIDQPGTRLELALAPPGSVPVTMWPREFSGRAVGLDRLGIAASLAHRRPTPAVSRTTER